MCARACAAPGFPGATDLLLRRTRRCAGRLLALRIRAVRIGRCTALLHALYRARGGPRRCRRLAIGDRRQILPIRCSRHLLRRAALLRRRCKLRRPRISLGYRPRGGHIAAWRRRSAAADGQSWPKQGHAETKHTCTQACHACAWRTGARTLMQHVLHPHAAARTGSSQGPGW